MSCNNIRHIRTSSRSTAGAKLHPLHMMRSSACLEPAQGVTTPVEPLAAYSSATQALTLLLRVDPAMVVGPCTIALDPIERVPNIQHVPLNTISAWPALHRTGDSILHLLLPPLELHQPAVAAVLLPVEPATARDRHTESLALDRSVHRSIIVISGSI